ncbi:diguanylate cyclase [Pseudoduganella sp. RAF53_2]|uniref:GGDEF domain-containing protein n=1 Tax=unclassified Pseudoduganella TaxID=2637179 RepID=UPI003F9CF7E1
MRVRVKLMLALLFTGLAAVAMVGGLAYVSVNYKVDAIRRDQAAEHFHHFMTAYLAKYGDWQTANANESFDSFVRRTAGEQGDLAPLPPDRTGQRAALQRAGAAAGPDADSPRNGPPELRPHLDGRPDDAPPNGLRRLGGPPDDAPPHDGPPRLRPTLDGPPEDGPSRDGPRGLRPMLDGPPENGALRDGPPGPRPPPPDGPPGRGFRPPGGPPGEPRFRFVLADADYRVLLGGGQFHPGELLPEKLRLTSRPILVDGRAVAHMSTEGVLTPTRQEQEYLDAMKSSLLAGVAAAAVLALVLGWTLSRSQTRSVRSLTRAVRLMHKGELRQQVPVRGKDEVAQLAGAFNEMSEQLAQKHEELEASHQTILQQAEQLRELSIRDALTQLYNRRHFDEQATTLFNQAVRHKRPLTLVICDIDHFKKINDKYSHAIGDSVLRQVGSILRNHMRLSDLVARYGGEEFVMAFPETPGTQAAALCDKLRSLIENFDWHEVHPELKVTMSMGVCADIAAGTAEAMLQKADALLYRAKESGRNRVCCA